MVPRATYRLQLNADFGFDAASKILPYLAKLGISHVYLSPILQAAEGSSHGYDVIDHNRLSEELGGEPAYSRFCLQASKLGLKQVVDIVPNHMSIHDRRNAWWWDLLEDGPGSRYASYFDVDWDPPESKNRNVLLVPVLGDHRGRILDKREITVVRNCARFVFRYHEHAVPVAFSTIGQVLNTAAKARVLEASVEQKLQFFADACIALPVPATKDPIRRNQHKVVLIDLLTHFLEAEPSAAAAIDDALATLNDDPIAMDDFLNQQNHRLAYWRTGDRELDYRRFFDVNSLVGLRVEEEEVFRDTHRTLERLIRNGCIDGLRVDHVDGMADPQKYLERLRALAPKAWVVVEKILARDEKLRASWPVQGTTGYDFINEVNGLFIDSRAEPQFSELFTALTGEKRSFEEVAFEKREGVLREALAADVDRLVQSLADSCASTHMYRDYTRFDLRKALRIFVAAFPVYRTYVRDEMTEADFAQDTAWAEGAVNKATERRPDLDPELFKLIEQCLLRTSEGISSKAFSSRLQQLTSPATAKGVEDTAFYTWSRFIGLNEVGGSPGVFGTSVERFHQENLWALANTPHRMIASSTHDTKRSEGVRARLAALTEYSGQWADTAMQWKRQNAAKKTEEAPDADGEYLFYQTLVGAWPLTAERAIAFMMKASREAKTRTNWTAPNESYERNLTSFINACFADADFMSHVERTVDLVRHEGEVNSLSATLLKLTSPGVPDLYQGTELWSVDLVDPDNRRPVDFVTREKMLDELSTLTAAQAMQRRHEGVPKMMLIHRALELRARRPELFEQGTYEPITASSDNVVAYQRDQHVVVAVPRLSKGTPEKLESTTFSVPKGNWVNVITGEKLTGGTIEASTLFAQFPVALLERKA